MFCKNCTCDNCLLPVLEGKKRCNKCGDVFDRSFFNIDNKKGGRRGVCKNCIKIKNKEYYQKRKQLKINK